MEVSIEEKVKAVFEWAGLKQHCTPENDLYGEGLWTDGDTTHIRLPMPDDIEFLGYIRKYVFPKLQDDGYLITIEAKPNEYKYNTELHNVNRGGVKYSLYQDTPEIALLNSIYEVIK